MMNAHKIIPLLALLVLLLAVSLPAHSQTGIIVNNADAMRQEGVRLDSGLSSVTSNVGSRIVLQYANTKREERITAPPSALQTLFAQAPVRIVLQYANTMRQERIAAPPAGLQTLFGQVAPRIVLQYANTSRQETLAYPAALIGDAVAPVISNVQTQGVPGGVKITWVTNELTLTGLTAGRMYYFVVRGADRSGNQAQSGEYQVRVQGKTYLPLVRRR